MSKGLFLALSLAAWSGPATADAFRTPKLREGAPVPIQAYGRQNASCLEWTNGCVLCVKDETGHSNCSTPGIACTPAGLTCKRMSK